MKLHDLFPVPGSKKKAKRRGIGIGSGNGKTSGKGHKGQKARTGGGVAPYFEGGQMPLYRRTPKRGFSNEMFAKKFEEINVSLLDHYFNDGDTVGYEELKKHHLISARYTSVKILGDGEIKKKLTIMAAAFSASAKAKIEAAGGRAEVI